jgi:predicted nucleic acid-binding protein
VNPWLKSLIFLGWVDRIFTIGGYDVLIAGQARARQLVLVTRNIKEFARVDGLLTENWQDA